MLLWDIIRDFFVVHVFGGFTSNLEEYGGLFGYDNVNSEDYYVSDTYFNLFNKNITIGDYFSSLATIITMVAILLFCVFIIKKIIGIIFRLFTGSSAF